MSDNPLRTSACDPLGCRHPILQAGKGGLARERIADEEGRPFRFSSTDAFAGTVDRVEPAVAVVERVFAEAVSAAVERPRATGERR